MRIELNRPYFLSPTSKVVKEVGQSSESQFLLEADMATASICLRAYRLRPLHILFVSLVLSPKDKYAT